MTSPVFKLPNRVYTFFDREVYLRRHARSRNPTSVSAIDSRIPDSIAIHNLLSACRSMLGVTRPRRLSRSSPATAFAQPPPTLFLMYPFKF